MKHPMTLCVPRTQNLAAVVVLVAILIAFHSYLSIHFHDRDGTPNYRDLTFHFGLMIMVV